MHYKNDKLNGKAKGYYESGASWWEMTYKEGHRHGRSRAFYEDGKVWKELNFKDGKLDGVVKVYDGKNLSHKSLYRGGVKIHP